MATKKITSTTNNTTGSSDGSSSTPDAQPTAATITAVANGSNRGTKVDLQGSYSALVTGLLGNYGPNDTFRIGGVVYKRDEVIVPFNAFITAAENTKTDHADWLGSVQAERQAELAARPMRDGVRSILEADLGKSSQKLKQYGFTPARSPKKNAATTADAVARAQATRALRGTKGKKQKKKIQAPPVRSAQGQGQAVPPVIPAPAQVQAPVKAPTGANGGSSGSGG